MAEEVLESEERKTMQNIAAERVKAELSAKLKRGALGVHFEFLEMLVISKLRDGVYDWVVVGRSRAEELSESI